VMSVATLIDFLNKLNELERLRKELRVTIADKYNNIIEVEAELDFNNKPYFRIWSEHFQVEVPLEEMRKFADWLRDIGILEVKPRERDARG